MRQTSDPASSDRLRQRYIPPALVSVVQFGDHRESPATRVHSLRVHRLKVNILLPIPSDNTPPLLAHSLALRQVV